MAKKAKMNVKNLICALVYILMGSLLIGAYFMPVLVNSETITGNVVSTYSCSYIIANGNSDGGYMAFAIMGLASMILGCLMILGALIGLCVKVKNLDLLMICLTLLITIMAVAILIIAITKTGTALAIATTLGFAAFAFLIAGVLALLAALFQKSKL
ncbi:MAG: hypothetical protein IJU58_00355 [Clostridia bacterium]|nr:hypothetical protein [Clostridia bacterium]